MATTRQTRINTLLLMLAGTLLAVSIANWLARPVARAHVAPRSTRTFIDVNSADLPDLCLLPGVGPGLAPRIIDARAAVGPFATVDDLTRVKGIGPKTLAKMRPFVTKTARADESAPRGVVME
mgnify:CR=1 FL=1